MLIDFDDAVEMAAEEAIDHGKKKYEEGFTAGLMCGTIIGIVFILALIAAVQY